LVYSNTVRFSKALVLLGPERIGPLSSTPSSDLLFFPSFHKHLSYKKRHGLSQV
jgi:hypothetical protein